MNHSIPSEHLKQIGDVIVSFALLELRLQQFIGSLINEHQRIGQIISAELSFKNLRALLLSLYKERHGETDDFLDLKILMNKSGKIEEKRNQIMHSIWAVGKDNNYITRIKRTAKEKKGLVFKFENLSSDDIKSIADEIKSVADEILNLYLKLMGEGKIINNPRDNTW